MTGTERLSELVSEVPASAQRNVGGLLRQLAHDMNGPLSTFMMEIYTLRRRQRTLAQIANEQGMPDVNEMLARITPTINNMEAAASRAAEYIRFLEDAGIGLQTELGEPNGGTQ